MPRSSRPISFSIATLIALILLSDSVVRGQLGLPPGFSTTELISTGLTAPTCMCVADDGTVYIAEKGGTIRVWREQIGVLPDQFFANAPLSVYSVGEAGLIGLALDPEFGTNHYVYVHYIRSTNPRRARISRFTADTAGNLALPGSEAVLLDLSVLTGGGHYGGAIHFGPDGFLYVGVGENGQSNNSQSIDTQLGKILRLRPVPGNAIPDDNPTSFAGISGTPTGDNRAIWAVGLRNPFTFAFQPGTGRMIINDVGGSFEELNEGGAGRNYGWPEWASNPPLPQYITHPLLAYDYQYNAAIVGRCVAGGVFYNPTTTRFPSDYLGSYFFGDYQDQWINRLDLINGHVKGLNWLAGRVVDLDVDNQGRLLFLRYGTPGRLVRIDYQVPPPRCEAGQLNQFQVPQAADFPFVNLLGQAIASSNDTAVIGAPWDSTTPGSPGAAHVFVRDGASWVQQAKLSVPSASGYGGVGAAVAVRGDTILLGRESDIQYGAPYSGSVCVFRRNGTIWSHEATLISPFAGSQQRFGHTVALAADMALIGSTGVASATGSGMGAVHVFVRNGENWWLQFQLLASDGVAGDHFGCSLAVDGDTMVVGAQDADRPGAAQVGAAYVFVRQSGIWMQQAKLMASDSDGNDNFGSSVAISGDSAAIGAANDGAAGANAGSAYIFRRVGGQWMQEAKLSASDALPGDKFGASVTISNNTLIVGANEKRESGGSYAGAAYIYTSNGTNWTQRAKLVPDEGRFLDRFGTSVWISGTTVLIGAPGSNGTDIDEMSSTFEFDLSLIRNAGDINGDGIIDGFDLGQFVDVLLGIDIDPIHVTRSDMDCSGQADGRDIQTFVHPLLGN